MKIAQLTETGPIELARAILGADDINEFPIIQHAAIELLDKLKTFEVEYSYFEFDDADEACALSELLEITQGLSTSADTIVVGRAVHDELSAHFEEVEDVHTV